MKKFFILIPAMILCLISCSTSDSDSDSETDSEVDPEFAMTAKINDYEFKANTAYGNNKFSEYTIWDYYPSSEFILLQAREGSAFSDLREINIWLKKSDIAVGTYRIGPETFEVKPSHYVDFVFPSNSEPISTKEGEIVIEEVNTSAKTVKGTFEFTTVPYLDDPSSPVNFRIKEGKFNYTYQ